MAHIFTRHELGPICGILLLGAAAASCQGQTLPLPRTVASSPAATINTSSSQPTPSPTDMMETPTIPAPQPESPRLRGGSIEERAQQVLTDWLGVSGEEIEVLEVEEVEWPDTSLGCPQPGMVYAQVIVPGWRVMMRADDGVYEYHSGEGHGLLCDQQDHLIYVVPSPTVTPITVPSTPTPAIEDVCPMMPVAPHRRACPTPRTPDDQ